MPVAGPGVSPKHFVHLLACDVRVGDAEAVVATEFEQSLSVIVHPANALVA